MDETDDRAPGPATDERGQDERKRYTTRLQRRAQAHVTAELGPENQEADVDRQVAMLIQHTLEATGARRVSLYRPVPRGQRWHVATVLEDGGFYYGLVAPDSLVLPRIAFAQKRSLLLGPDRPHAIPAPRVTELGFRSYLGLPLVNAGEVVAVLEAVDVAQSELLERYAANLEPTVAALAEAFASERRRVGLRPQQSPQHGLTGEAVLDLVLRPPIDQDATIELAPTDWALLHRLNGERPLLDAASAAGLALPHAIATAAALLERGLIRIGRENRRRG